MITISFKAVIEGFSRLQRVLAYKTDDGMYNICRQSVAERSQQRLINSSCSGERKKAEV